MNADGSNQHQIVRPGGTTSDYLPAWSPDGKYILYSETSPNLTALSTLVKFTLDNEKAQDVQIEVPVVDVAFSPDGQWIVYEKSDSINQSVFIYPMAGGASEQKLANALDNSFDPAWRPEK
jgi:Tol biopolymer transport system component